MQVPSAYFTPLERALLSELQLRLRPDAAELLARQLQRINLIQRHSNSREVCCYPMKRGVVFHEPMLQFPRKDRELRLATIVFSCPSCERIWTAKFFVVHGYFFSIVFDRNPKEIRDCAILNIEQVQIHYDPMQASSQAAEVAPATSLPTLPNWISFLLEHGPIYNVNSPLNYEQREAIIYQFNVRFPADYLELVERCDGLIVGDWSIFGLSEIYEIHLPQGDYIVLAELHGYGALLFDSRDELLYYANYTGGELVSAGKSFGKALVMFQDEVAP